MCRLVHVAAKIGTFRWNDAAEPTGNRPVVHVQRKMLEIKDKNLERTLLENKLMCAPPPRPLVLAPSLP